MAVPDIPSEFDELTMSEKIAYVQRLWERIAANPSAVELTEEQRAELDRRLEAHRENPEDVVSWEDVKDALGSKK